MISWWSHSVYWIKWLRWEKKHWRLKLLRNRIWINVVTMLIHDLKSGLSFNDISLPDDIPVWRNFHFKRGERSANYGDLLDPLSSKGAKDWRMLFNLLTPELLFGEPFYFFLAMCEFFLHTLLHACPLVRTCSQGDIRFILQHNTSRMKCVMQTKPGCNVPMCGCRRL